MNAQNDPVLYDREYQRQIIHEFRSWDKKRTEEREHQWGLFLFSMSLARAMGIPWRDIGNMLGLSRTEARTRYWGRIFELRPDVVAYARVQPDDEATKFAILNEIKDAHQRAVTLDVAVHNQVLKLREDGASWATLGKCLGITRQAAQQRYGQPSGRSFRRVPTLADRHAGVVDSLDPASNMAIPVPRQGAQDQMGTKGEQHR